MKADRPVSLKAQFAGRDPIPSGFNQSLPGNLVMFLMMNLLIFGGSSVAEERASGVLRRLAVYPIRHWELVLGKVYGRFLLGGAQIIFFLLLGRFVFEVNLGLNLIAVLVTLGLYAWVAASLGVWIGAVVKQEDKIVGLCVLTSMLMAALGGCWWPLEIVPEAMQVIGHFVPTAWALDALHQLINFGGGWESVLSEIGVLAGFAAGATLGAGRMFRF
jgi:ABC-type multidrug transport system permease subunit